MVKKAVSMLAWGSLLITSSLFSTKKPMNIIKSVYHHPSQHMSDSHAIECGNLIFYFDAQQRVDLLKVDKGSKKETRTFFFPLAHAKNANVKRMLDELAHVSNEYYSFDLEQAEKPLKGVRLTVQFDPRKTGLTYDTFDSINLKKGVVFRFHNRTFLDTLHKSTGDILRVSSNDKKRVIIDCGHGGDDDGALGHFGLKEKDLNLNIGIAVAYLLKKKGIDVLMTRIEDITKSLSDRVTFANNHNADLFVSIHSNSAHNHTAHGLETFSMVPSCVHTGTSSLDPKDLNIVLEYHKNRLEKSTALAQSLQSSILDTVRPINEQLKDRKVKQAVLLVLLGTMMPSALVEVGFISNEQEAAKLNTQSYQRHVALGIYRGILNYLDTVA